jgi:alpha-amylase/alpha-mannosidase (GH57 family)
MPYHHIILPLASRRDKVTEVRWGIADFRRRFEREPEGMWLPETAVDEESLEVLAEAGILFTILAPHQVEKTSELGLPLRFRAAKGREIALCTYDQTLSGDIAFGRLTSDGALLARRLAPAATLDHAIITAAAVDGETLGHHHHFGEMALARAFRILAEHDDIRVENFASFLARNPPRMDAVLVSPSSWSCSHGVERWRSDDGCQMEPGTSQAWRAPLRSSLEWLATQLHEIFEREGNELFAVDPWAVREHYGDVITASEAKALAFVAESITRRNDGARVERAAELLAMEEASLSMFTSDAWFFDDIARIETIQVLKYAAFAIELSGDAARLESGLLERMGDAKSNDPAEGTGRDVWYTKVKPTHVEIVARE